MRRLIRLVILEQHQQTGRRADDQSFEDTVWDWPAGIDANGNRVSIARKTSSKVTADGTAASAWVSSLDDSRLSQLRELTFLWTF